jgi:serine protease Do
MMKSKYTKSGWTLVSTIILFSIMTLLISGCTKLPATASPMETPAQVLSHMPSLSRVVNIVWPSVVYITDVINDPVNGPTDVTGSGVIFSPDGYILTNKHVVNNADNAQVILSDRSAYNVANNNIWMDDLADLAVIKIDGKNLPTAQFGDPDTIKVGDWVVAIGNALGLSPVEGGPTVTDGIVSNLGRSLTIDTTRYYDLIQTSAAINPGNSGGPLINMDGQVIGINSAGATQAQNIGFAINVGTAQHIYNDLVKYGRPDHPYLGAVPDDITAQIMKSKTNMPKAGAIISSIEFKSPADLAGLKQNDIIVLFGNETVSSAADLIKAIWRNDVGDKVEVVFWRNGEQRTLSIVLAQRPGEGAI